MKIEHLDASSTDSHELNFFSFVPINMFCCYNYAKTFKGSWTFYKRKVNKNIFLEVFIKCNTKTLLVIFPSIYDT